MKKRYAVAWIPPQDVSSVLSRQVSTLKVLFDDVQEEKGLEVDGRFISLHQFCMKEDRDAGVLAHRIEEEFSQVMQRQLRLPLVFERLQQWSQQIVMKIDCHHTITMAHRLAMQCCERFVHRWSDEDIVASGVQWNANERESLKSLGDPHTHGLFEPHIPLISISSKRVNAEVLSKLYFPRNSFMGESRYCLVDEDNKGCWCKVLDREEEMVI